jgi:hypothetical protein
MGVGRMLGSEVWGMGGAGSTFRAQLVTMQVAAQYVYDVNARVPALAQQPRGRLTTER